ncbi:hypothetical protein VXQ18_02760 [Brucella abortus]|nr:hypothetical protein [Brucella abortus]
MKQEINTFILQAGVDGQFYEDENGKLIAGITGHMVLHAAILWRGMVMAVSPPMPGASARYSHLDW